MKEKALKGAPIWFKKILAYLFRGQPPYPMVAPGLFTQLRNRGIPVWCVYMCRVSVMCLCSVILFCRSNCPAPEASLFPGFFPQPFS